jgi:hypothetical protein
MSMLCAIFMIWIWAGNAAVQTTPRSKSQDQSGTSRFRAIVKPSQAQFFLTVPKRPKWSWRLPATKDNGQEYRMDVTLRNEGREYTFGFYLWKRAGASTQSGDLADLIEAGQASVFERSEPGRMTIIRDAGIKLKLDGTLLTIQIRGSENLKRLFSSKPSEATFKLRLPDEDLISEGIAIKYEN